MAQPLNEQNIIDRVAEETISENEVPSGSAARPQRQKVHTASGTPNESKGFYGTAGNPGTN